MYIYIYIYIYIYVDIDINIDSIDIKILINVYSLEKLVNRYCGAVLYLIEVNSIVDHTCTFVYIHRQIDICIYYIYILYIYI